MWTAKITEKTEKGGALFIAVSFQNGTSQYVELIDFTGGSKDVLNSKISSRLKTLNDSESFSSSVVLGDFTPVAKPVSDEFVFIGAARRLQELKTYTDLGIIEKDDPDYISALQAAKDAYKNIT